MQSRIRHFSDETICSCDPDSNTPSFALFVGREVLWVGKVAVEPGGLWLRQVACLARHSDLLVIEGQYLPANLPPREAIKRWPSLLTLIVARGEIQAQWKVLGKTAHVVQPGTWQRSLGASSLGRDRLKGLSRMKASDILQRKLTVLRGNGCWPSVWLSCSRPSFRPFRRGTRSPWCDRTSCPPTRCSRSERS